MPAERGGLSKGLNESFFLTTEVSEIIKFKEPKPWDDSSFLTHLYVKKQWSLRRISKELGCHKSVVRKKLKQAGVDDFEFVVEQDKLLLKKVESMRERGLSYQRIADLLNIWNIKTRSGDGKWHAKTVREME
ncbi:MAG: hypothetical protein ACPGJV_11625 [Bacteriovoracaceae bacterium]